MCKQHILAKEGVCVERKTPGTTRQGWASRARKRTMASSGSDPFFWNRQSMNAFLKYLFALGLLAVLPVFAQGEEKQQVEEQRSEFGTTHPEMLAAIAQARATLDAFLELVRYPEPDTSTFKLKILVRDGKSMEVFWIKPFWILADGFQGVIANAPEIVGNVQLGQTVDFSRSDVIDWGYVRNGRQVGSFTVCVLFRYMRPFDADYFRRNNGFDC